MEPSSYLALAPEIAVVVGGILIMMLAPFTGDRRRLPPGIIPILAVVAVLAGLALLALQPSDIPESSWQSHFSNDAVSVSFRSVFLVIIFLTLLFSIEFLRREAIDHGEYYALVLFTYLGMAMMAAGADFLTTFVGLEILSIGSYALLGFKRTDLRANESSLKYFILGSFSSAVFLYGIVLIYGSCGTTRYLAIAQSIAEAGGGSPLLVAGLALTLVGLGFKLAVFPFQGWAPDVYEGAPTPVTGFMSVAPKAAALAALLRVLFVAFAGLDSYWVELLAWLAVATMTIGNLAALIQTNLKRMLAYSSIAHAGYMLVAFMTGFEDAAASLLFYTLAYGMMNLGAFAVISLVSRRGDNRVFLQDYAGMGFRQPLLSACLTLFLLSLVGIPLTGGFMAKFYLFSAAVRHGWTGLVVVAALNSVVSVYYYLRVVVYMYMGPSGGDSAPLSVPIPAAVGIAIATLGTLWLGITPTWWLSLAQNSVLALK